MLYTWKTFFEIQGIIGYNFCDHHTTHTNELAWGESKFCRPSKNDTPEEEPKSNFGVSKKIFWKAHEVSVLARTIRSLHFQGMLKVMIYVECVSKEISKQFSRSKILNMVWNPYISEEK